MPEARLEEVRVVEGEGEKRVGREVEGRGVVQSR